MEAKINNVCSHLGNGITFNNTIQKMKRYILLITLFSIKQIKGEG
jgi:hypothetical protein